MADEIENPRRVIPRALLVGGQRADGGLYCWERWRCWWRCRRGEVSGVDGFMHGVAVLCGRFGLGWLVVLMAGLVALNAVGGAAGVSVIHVAAAVCRGH